MGTVNVVSKRPQSGHGHFTKKDYLDFFDAWSSSRIAKISKLTVAYDPARQDPVRVEISLNDQEQDMLFEDAFECHPLLMWRGNFHKWV